MTLLTTHRGRCAPSSASRFVRIGGAIAILLIGGVIGLIMTGIILAITSANDIAV